MIATFIMDNRPESGLGHVVRSRALATELEARGWQTEAVALGNEIADHNVCVMDLRPDVRFYVPRCVQVVDEPEETPKAIPPCQILVIGSAGANVDMFKGVPAVRVLAGPRFSLLRPEFSAISSQHREGISDLRNIAGWSAQELAMEMTNARVVITYGGMRAMECAATGTPTVIVPRNPGERLNADGLVAAGACVIAAEDEAEMMAQTALECPELLDKMGRNARALVDGKGIKRVAAAIEDIAA